MSALPDVLGTGSRCLSDRGLVWRSLDEVAARFGAFRLRLGKCPDGFDALAEAWAVARGVEVDPVAADWDSCAWDCPAGPHRRVKKPGDRVHPGMLPDYCPGAGPRRNARMVARGGVLCVAAPVGRSFGTRGCMRLAQAAGIPVWDVTRAGGRPW